MDTELIIFSEYCERSHSDPTFLVLLQKGGLIEIRTIAGEQYLLVDQICDLKKYTSLYYDLSINIEGIDAIRHMLDRIHNLQDEVCKLRQQLHVFEKGDEVQ